jgi:hypothetical protein
MGNPIEDPLALQCGNCKFWDATGRPPGTGGECTGAPPTACIIGGQPRKFGPGVDFQVEMMRPIMASNARPCSLHQRTMVFDLKSLGPASKLS